ncbi:MAG TPA: cytochrome c [Longimicrobium sp.]|nr:cytochrome c [Longimicrobium sp.]
MSRADERPLLTAVEEARRRIRRRRWMIVLALLAGVAIAGYLWFRRNFDRPVDYADIGMHFKYGSIGSDNPVRGIPIAIFKVLPKAFPQYLPPGGPRDYTAFGFVQEPGQELPVGFSRRRFVIELAGLNCASCHTSTVRAAPDAEPVVYLGMPSHTVNLQALFKFFFDCAADQRFTPQDLMPLVEAETKLNPVERYLLRTQAIPQMRTVLLAQRDRLAYMFEDGRAPAGPGRVDTFGPYKAIQYRFPMTHLPARELAGTSDFPSIWNQEPREGLQLHWDGNNTSVRERNFSAAFGAGATPATVDIPRMNRIADWLRDFPAPRYPFPVDAALAAQGEGVYRRACYSCHGANDFGARGRDRRETRVGRVTRLADVGTDPHRLWSFTPEVSVHQATLMAGTVERLSHFRVTDGYANLPLDGVWLRAPYLHNGSVPTLYDLLKPAAERPRAFYRGNDVYDQRDAGFVHTVAEQGGRRFFLHRTHRDDGEPLPANSNQGHEYGTGLSEAEKRQLVEYLKTL